MNACIDQIRGLVTAGEARLSEHGYAELVDDGIIVEELMAAVTGTVLMEGKGLYELSHRNRQSVTYI